MTRRPDDSGVSRRTVVLAVALLALLGAAAGWWLFARSAAKPGAGETTDAASQDPVPAGAPGLAAAAATGQGPAGSATAPQQDVLPTGARKAHEGRVLAGVVVDEAGKPLEGVRILVGRRKAFVESDPPVRSGADGMFSLAGSEAVTVKALAPGRTLVGTEASFEPGKTARLVMVPASVVRVRVVEDVTGAAVPGALVRALTGTWIQAAFAMDLDVPFADEGTTDEDGRASLSTEGGPATVLVVPVVHAPVRVMRVNVPPEGKDLVVRVVRGGVVEGRALDPEGKPAAGARVTLFAPPVCRKETRSGPDGRFRILGVAGGELPLVVERERMAIVLADAPGFGPGLAPLDPFDPDATSTVDVRLSRAHRVAGTVRTARGGAAAGFEVQAERESPDSPLFSVLDDLRATTDAEGRFAFDSVGAGTYLLWARSRSLHAMAMVVVPEDGDPLPVEMVLPDRSGRMTVRVVDPAGAPVAGASVEVKSGPPVVDTVARGRADAAGIARLSGLPTDAATVQVRPSASVTYAKEVGPAELAGGEATVTVAGGEIAGVALNGDGTPARVRFRLERLIGGCLERGEPAETDADGRFRFQHLPAGSFELAVEGEENVLVATWPRVGPGVTDLRVWVVSVAESALWHVELALVDGRTGDPVRLDGHVGVELTPVPAGSGPRMTQVLTASSSEPSHFLTYSAVPPGTYDVSFSALGWKRVRVTGVTVPRVGRAPVVRLEKGLRFEGRVVDAAGKGIPDVTVIVGDRGGTSEADGTFAVEGLDSGESEATATGDLVVEAKRPVHVPAVAGEPFVWTLVPAGALDVSLPDTRESGIERIRVTPLAGGEPKVEEDDGPLRRRRDLHGARFPSLASGRYRVEAWQTSKTWPAQEVDVRAGEVATVRFGD